MSKDQTTPRPWPEPPELPHSPQFRLGYRQAQQDGTAEIARLRAENADLRESVIAFGAPWAASYARDFGFPPGHLHPTHYDILARAGARMDDFIRGDVNNGR